ncbi:MAG: peptidoglycan-binding protein [Syntrophomonadaceae bacterium]|nr:peptidoglycan-binding protein [Syntrophomonadaceae bacterium]MDD3889109.1 peptidoglycan-binding protein [Syntrophomonadaceae bacterium]MDD4549366.1 peptidoglycan-binding protein [Syntrophomonadaceae bacterium]
MDEIYYYLGIRNLRLTTPNQQGRDVRILQSLLNMFPDNIVPGKLVVDGIFGPITRTAVRNFQRYFGLVVDGVVGQESFLRLGHRIGKYAVGEAVFSSRYLSSGARGGDVSVLQNRLAAYKKGYLNRRADGRFGFFTDAAVQRLQSDFLELAVDGVANPDTYEQIFIRAPLGGRTLRQNDRGLDVYWLQYYLYQLNYYKGEINGYFQSSTTDAVKDFQTAAGITIDGIVGPETYLTLGTNIAFPQQEYYYRVQPGDSVFSISRLFNKEIEDIINLNNLTPPDYIIKIGQLLLIPVPLSFHLALKGETLADVASKYSLPLSSLQAANNLIPEGALLPDESVVLPGYSADLMGEVAFLQQKNDADELIKLDLNSGAATSLQVFDNLSERQLFLSKDRKSVALFANGGKQIIIYDLTTGISRTLNLSESADYLDWSYDGQKLVVNNGLVISALNGTTLFSFTGMMPQWFTDNKSLLYTNGESSLRKIDIETGTDELVVDIPDISIWFFQLAAPINKVIVMGFVDPGRVTFTYLYDLANENLIEISRNDFFAEWSRNYASFLLLQRDYYGEFFPWFYLDVKQYSAEGDLKGRELYAKDVILNNDNFAPADQAFLPVLSNPATFYPIPVINRDIYAKNLNSQLLTQLTLGTKTYSPVWL